MIAQAVEAAKKSDVVIIVGDGRTVQYDVCQTMLMMLKFDKKDMYMPFGQDELIKAVQK